MVTVKRYHINPKTGNPNVCSAALGNCPFGSPAEHYSTKEQARRAYESGQRGSFKKPSPQEPAAQLWEDAVDFSKAPVGTVVEFTDGLRFMKTDALTWETSAKGGLIRTSDELSHYPQDNDLKPGVRTLDVHREDSAPAPKGSIKVSTLHNARFEEGRQAHKYFLLLNHRDPKQLEAAIGTVKDQELVKDVIEYSALLERKAELEESLELAKKRLQESKSAAQGEGYARVARWKEQQLRELSPELSRANSKVVAHGKRYAAQLVIHRRSLASLERLAAEGVKSSPPGIAKRIASLEELQRSQRSVKELAKKMQGNKPKAVLAAAKEFGNPVYVQRAQRFLESSQALDALNSEMAALQRTHNSVNSRAVQQAAREELEKAQERRGRVTKEFNEAVAAVKIFHDDIRARLEQEQDVARELNLLKTISS